MKRWLISCTLASAALLAALPPASALPSVDAVQAEVQRGNYAGAETMMQEVVTAKPGSARAHYIYAEILAHNQRFDAAERELKQARQLDPAAAFAQPDKLKSFEQTLQRARTGAATPSTALTVPTAAPAAMAGQRPAPAPDSGTPGWLWALGGGAVALVLWRVMGRSRATPPAGATMGMPATAAAGYGAPGYGAPGYGAMPPQGGNSMLHTGLAVAGGMAAGALAAKMFEGDHHGSHADADYRSSAAPGGLVPGMFDDGAGSAAADLQSRAIDFGNGDAGGDGWGGGSDGTSGGDGGSDGW